MLVKCVEPRDRLVKGAKYLVTDITNGKDHKTYYKLSGFIPLYFDWRFVPISFKEYSNKL